MPSVHPHLQTALIVQQRAISTARADAEASRARTRAHGSPRTSQSRLVRVLRARPVA